MSNTNWINREEYPFESHHFEVSAGRLHYVPEACSIRLSSVGHFVQEEAPDELAKAVASFLKEIEPAQ